MRVFRKVQVSGFGVECLGVRVRCQGLGARILSRE